MIFFEGEDAHMALFYDGPGTLAKSCGILGGSSHLDLMIATENTTWAPQIH